ncbi:MAG: MotA/TolQ/ExbB proton channel family protein [Pirellulales bacterium]
MDLLVETLYFLSTALLVPVIVVLLGLVAWTLLEIGGFLRETRERRRQRSAWESLVTEMHHASPPLRKAAWTAFFQQRATTGLLAAFAVRGRALRESELHLGKLLSDLEIEAASRLARMSLGVRVGPMLGLMGTLIPLGPALIGLSTGNIETLARHLVVAFSTTVLGLFVGGSCYALWLVRRQWYARDLADVEFVYHCLHAAEGEPADVSGNSQPPREVLRAPTADCKP